MRVRRSARTIGMAFSSGLALGGLWFLRAIVSKHRCDINLL
jgi:hypothetical protein